MEWFQAIICIYNLTLITLLREAKGKKIGTYVVLYLPLIEQAFNFPRFFSLI